MKISESETREWYESNGISDTDWDMFEDFTKEMLAVEAIASEWDEVEQMRETGIPESAVLIYFNAEECGLDANEVEHLGEENSYEGLTPYILNETTSQNLESLFNDSTPVNVLSVDSIRMNNGTVNVVIEVEGSDLIFQ